MPLPRSIHPSAGSRKPGRLLDSGGPGRGQVGVIGILALEWAVVGGDHPLQLRLGIHELLVLQVLLLDVHTHITQLGLDTAD